MNKAFDEIIQMHFKAIELIEIARSLTLTMKNLNAGMTEDIKITAEEGEALKMSIENMSSIMNKIGVALEKNASRS